METAPSASQSMPPPAYCRPAAFAAFAGQLPHIETTPGLFRAAFAIAQHERPTANLAQAEVAVAQLVDTVRRRVHSPSFDAKLAHLHDVLFDVIGFAGNNADYYDPANSYVPEVLRTRRGLPITLVLVYKCVAEGVGLTVHGINSPGHFLAEVECPNAALPRRNATSPMYVDPFYGGGLLTEADVFKRIADATGQTIPASPELLARATGRQWLARMLTNLEAVFASAGRERDLFAMQELQSLLETAA
jgi:regulator of sirC expression with transglutaminase-like and TPR domain